MAEAVSGGINPAHAEEGEMERGLRGACLVEALPQTFISHLISFLRHLKSTGLSLSTKNTLGIMEGMKWIRIEDKNELYALLSAHSVSHPDHIPLFDKAFESFWARRESDHVDEEKKSPQWGQQFPEGSLEVTKRNKGRKPHVQECFRYSFEETLSKKDLAALAETESREMIQLIQKLSQTIGVRLSRRWRSRSMGKRLDLRKSFRYSLKSGGELVRLLRKGRDTRRMHFSILCDVSGSMESYSRFLLEFAHGFQKHVPDVDTFVFSTRLSRTTSFLRPADRREAYQRLGDHVSDWSGGTRIGSSLATYNRTYVKRFPAKDSICIIVSDGWDQGDIPLLEREIRQLKRHTGCLMWLNPLIALPDYRPIDRGMSTVLPHTDDFLDCHNLDQLSEFGKRLENRCSGILGQAS